jgi:hypothetical protein
MIRQEFGEDSMSCSLAFEWHALSEQTEKGETGEQQDQEHAHREL